MAGLIKNNRKFCHISRWFLSPVSGGSTREHFFSISCGNLVELLEVNLRIFGNPYGWILLEFLTFKVVHTESPGICQFQFGFSYSAAGSVVVLLISLCSGKSWLSVCPFVPPILRAEVHPVCSPVSLAPRTAVVFLVCSPFYLLGQSCNSWFSCIRNQELDLIMF